MNNDTTPIIFGEVLFDCFPDGAQVLGGAPFNVAWHLQALGLSPLMVSRVGCDELGTQIENAMQSWGLTLKGLQKDTDHPTGQVTVNFHKGEPNYNIVPKRAYDFIDAKLLPDGEKNGLLYHGTLALRHEKSSQALTALKQTVSDTVLLDVNLRSPWWNKEQVLSWMQEADWVKLNDQELQLLGLNYGKSLQQSAEENIEEFQLSGIVITQGKKGALAMNSAGTSKSVTPRPAKYVVDTVGAGDAFTAVVVAGIIQRWTLDDTLEKAQQLASAIVGIRGALPYDRQFYKDIFG